VRLFSAARLAHHGRVHVRLVTCLKLPEPDPDRDVLVEALAARGVTGEWVAWDDPTADFTGGLSLIRSTWNYYRTRDRFIAWTKQVERSGTLQNPARIVRWNSHKRYLRDLAKAGFPVVPTEFLRQGGAIRLSDIASRRGWTSMVVKPAVSAGSFQTMHVTDACRAAGEAHLASLLLERDALVQPYVRSVDDYGERALVWIDGALTHAIRKAPRFSGEAERASEAQPIAFDEKALAGAIFARFGAGLLYGRLDLARDDQGKPRVMELELIEPSLFLLQCDAALTHFAHAIARLAR